jgi:Xaa-Pro dipeptidase
MAKKASKPKISAFAPNMMDHHRLNFTVGEYQRRYDIVTKAMEKAGVDVLMVRGPENICYLTGYETPGYYGYHNLIIPRGGQPILVMRNFESLNVPEYTWLPFPGGVEIVWDWEVPVEVTGRVIKRLKLDDKRIGVEKTGWFHSVAEYEGLMAQFPKAKIVDCSKIVENARVVKSDEEVATMRKAARILDRAVQAGIDAIAGGVTDNYVAAEVNHVLIDNGSQYYGLPPFVLSGERTCLPHQSWRNTVIEEGDPVYFEVSANVNRYSAAIMRCANVGEPTKLVRDMSNAVIGAVQAACDKIKPGVTCEQVDTAARDVVKKAGFGDYWRHRLGYSIGVNFPPDWGEGQILSLRQGEKRKLEENMTFHMVPLVLKYREAGIGFSATVRVTKNGCEVLNGLPLELVIV